MREVSGALGATDGFSDDLVLGLGNVDLVVAVRSFVDGSRYRRTRLVRDLDDLAASVTTAAQEFTRTDENLAHAAGQGLTTRAPSHRLASAGRRRSRSG